MVFLAHVPRLVVTCFMVLALLESTSARPPVPAAALRCLGHGGECVPSPVCVCLSSPADVDALRTKMARNPVGGPSAAPGAPVCPWLARANATSAPTCRPRPRGLSVASFAALCVALADFAVVALHAVAPGAAPAPTDLVSSEAARGLLDDALGTARSAYGLAVRLLEDLHYGFLLPLASVVPTAPRVPDRISAQELECAREVGVALVLLMAVVASVVFAFTLVPAPLVVLVCSSFVLRKTLGTVSVLFFKSSYPTLMFQNESRLVLPALALQYVRVVSYGLGSNAPLSFSVWADTVSLACLASTAVVSLLLWAFVLVVPQEPGEKARLAFSVARSVFVACVLVVVSACAPVSRLWGCAIAGYLVSGTWPWVSRALGLKRAMYRYGQSGSTQLLFVSEVSPALWLLIARYLSGDSYAAFWPLCATASVVSFMLATVSGAVL
eukprot:m51a1_g2346 hypothetical protein (441) ;mRNA; r:571492-572955